MKRPIIPCIIFCISASGVGCGFDSNEPGDYLAGVVRPNEGPPPNFSEQPLSLALRWHLAPSEGQEQYAYQQLAVLEEGFDLAGPESWYLKSFEMPTGAFQVGGLVGITPPEGALTGLGIGPPHSGQVPIAIAEIVVLEGQDWHHGHHGTGALMGVSEDYVLVWAAPTEPLGLGGGTCYLDSLVPFARDLTPGLHLAKVTATEGFRHPNTCGAGGGDGATDCLSLDATGFESEVLVRLPNSWETMSDIKIPNWSECW